MSSLLNFFEARIIKVLGSSDSELTIEVMDNNYTLEKHRDGGSVTQGTLTIKQDGDPSIKEVLFFDQIKWEGMGETGKKQYVLNIAKTSTGKLMRGLVNNPTGAIADNEIRDENKATVNYKINSLVIMAVDVTKLNEQGHLIQTQFDELETNIQNQQDTFENTQNGNYVDFVTDINQQQTAHETTTNNAISTFTTDINQQQTAHETTTNNAISTFTTDITNQQNEHEEQVEADFQSYVAGAGPLSLSINADNNDTFDVTSGTVVFNGVPVYYGGSIGNRPYFYYGTSPMPYSISLDSSGNLIKTMGRSFPPENHPIGTFTQINYGLAYITDLQNVKNVNVAALETLSDTTIETPTVGQVLTRTSSEWVNLDLPARIKEFEIRKITNHETITMLDGVSTPTLVEIKVDNRELIGGRARVIIDSTRAVSIPEKEQKTILTEVSDKVEIIAESDAALWGHPTSDLTGYSFVPRSPRIMGVNISENGEKLYVRSKDVQTHYSYYLIEQHTLGTAWDLSSGTSYDNYYMRTDHKNYIDICTSTDGAFFYAISYDGYIYRDSLSTAYDISNRTTNGGYDISNRTSDDSVDFEINSTTSLSFNPTGNILYIFDNKTVYQYSLSTSWDLTSVVLVTSKEIFSTALGEPNINSGTLSRDGTKLYTATNVGLYSFYLVTPWQINTILYEDIIYLPTTGMYSICWNLTGDKFLVTTRDATFSQGYIKKGTIATDPSLNGQVYTSINY